jgi:hypothetical protein
MFCGQCGAQVHENAVFCPACGARIESPPAAPPGAESPTTIPESTRNGEQSDYNAGGNTPLPHIKNYLVESILCVIFCCRPFAIVGIVFAAQVDKFLRAGLIDLAMESSEKAKKWTLISFIVGLVVNVGFIALYATGIIAGLTDYSNWY